MGNGGGMRISIPSLKIVGLGINLVALAGFVVSLIWAGLAIGNHELFQQRLMPVFVFQGVCIVFLVARKIAKLKVNPHV